MNVDTCYVGEEVRLIRLVSYFQYKNASEIVLMAICLTAKYTYIRTLICLTEFRQKQQQNFRQKHSLKLWSIRLWVQHDLGGVTLGLLFSGIHLMHYWTMIPSIPPFCCKPFEMLDVEFSYAGGFCQVTLVIFVQSPKCQHTVLDHISMYVHIISFKGTHGKTVTCMPATSLTNSQTRKLDRNRQLVILLRQSKVMRNEC